MRVVTLRALAILDGRMHMRGSQLSLLLIVALKAQLRLFLDEDERSYDSVPFVTRLAAFRVAEGCVNQLLRRLRQNGLVALDALLGHEFSPRPGGRGRRGEGKENRRDDCESNREADRAPKRVMEHGHRDSCVSREGALSRAGPSGMARGKLALPQPPLSQHATRRFVTRVTTCLPYACSNSLLEAMALVRYPNGDEKGTGEIR